MYGIENSTIFIVDLKSNSLGLYAKSLIEYNSCNTLPDFGSPLITFKSNIQNTRKVFRNYVIEKYYC